MYSSDKGADISDGIDEQTCFVASIRKTGRPLVGAALTIPSTLVAQLIAERPECDFVMIDMEHAPFSAESATNLVHATAAASARSRKPCHCLVRVPSSGVEWIKWALDSGASGIIIPMINNATEAEQIIDRARYPPLGRRSFGPTMAALAQPGGSGGIMSYFERAQSGQTAIFPMIESRQGVENIEAIMAVDGVDGVFIGPFDLRLALGLPGALDGDEPIFQQALKQACAAAKRHKKVVGSMGIGVDMSAKRAEEGMSFLVAGADHTVIASGITSALLNTHKGAELAFCTKRGAL